MRKLIIQIARLGEGYQKDYQFKYLNGNEEIISDNYYSVTSIFLKEKVLNNQDCEILFLFPISLPVQNFNATGDEYLNECNALDLKRYFKNEYNTIASKHPHIKNNRYLVIPSLGTYRKNNKEVTFKSNIETITLHILNHLIKNYLDTLEELYVDISGGQNVYNASLLLSLHRFLPIYELYHAFGKKLKTTIIYSDPIIRCISPVNINTADFSAKAFFELPEVDYNKLDSFIRRIISNDYEQNDCERKKEELLNLFTIFLPTLFYSVKYGYVLLLPLVMKKINHDLLDDFIKKLLNLEIMQGLKIDSSNDSALQVDFTDYKSNYNLIVQLYFIYSIYIGIRKVFKNKLEDNLSFKCLLEEKEKSLEKIEIDKSEELENLFRKFNASGAFRRFMSELQNLMKEVDFLKLENMNDFTHDFLKSEYSRNPNFNSRNYTAHNGLEKNSVLLKLINSNNTSYHIEIKQKDLTENLKSIVKYLKK